LDITAVLIAAGRSTRMGQLKPLLPWAKTTLVNSQIETLSEAGVARVIVVLGYAANEIAPLVRGPVPIRIVVNPDYDQGKTTSIKSGLRELDEHAQGILLIAVDQPRPSWLLRRLIEQVSDHPKCIIQPYFEGKAGHPLLFDSSFVAELLEIDEESFGVRQVLKRHENRLQKVPIESEVVLLDLNTIEDYQKACSDMSNN